MAAPTIRCAMLWHRLQGAVSENGSLCHERAPAEVLIPCWFQIGSNAGRLMRCTNTCILGRRLAILAGYLVMRVGARFFSLTLNQRVQGSSP